MADGRSLEFFPTACGAGEAAIVSAHEQSGRRAGRRHCGGGSSRMVLGMSAPVVGAARQSAWSKSVPAEQHEGRFCVSRRGSVGHQKRRPQHRNRACCHWLGRASWTAFV